MLTFRIAFPEMSYADGEGRRAFSQRDAATAFVRFPASIAAGATSDLPSDDPGPQATCFAPIAWPAVRSRAAREPPRCARSTPGYFEAMGIPLHRGRLLRDDDT